MPRHLRSKPEAEDWPSNGRRHQWRIGRTPRNGGVRSLTEGRGRVKYRLPRARRGCGFKVFAAAVSVPVRSSAARAAHREQSSLLRLFRASDACEKRARPPCLYATNIEPCAKAFARKPHRNNWPETNVGASFARDAPRGRRSISQAQPILRLALHRLASSSICWQKRRRLPNDGASLSVGKVATVPQCCQELSATPAAMVDHPPATA